MTMRAMAPTTPRMPRTMPAMAMPSPDSLRSLIWRRAMRPKMMARTLVTPQIHTMPSTSDAMARPLVPCLGGGPYAG
jgi:hypothetical protein